MTHMTLGPGHAAVAGQRCHADKGGFQRHTGFIHRDGFQFDAQVSEILLGLAACFRAQPVFQQHSDPAFITAQIRRYRYTGAAGQLTESSTGKGLRAAEQF